MLPSQSEIETRFINIYGREYELPKDVNESDYEMFFMTITFLGDCEVPVHEDKIADAYDKYERFAILHSIYESVIKKDLNFKYDEESNDYIFSLTEKSRNRLENKENTAENDDQIDRTNIDFVKYEKNMNEQAIVLFNDYIAIVNDVKNSSNKDS